MAQEYSIRIYKHAPLSVWNGAKRLSAFTGIKIIEEKKTEGKFIEIKLNEVPILNLGDEGFIIERTTNNTITISSNFVEGIVNGMYEMLRTLMCKNVRDPFSMKWNIKENPFFKIRGIHLGCYNFGLPELTPDMWTMSNWKEYIDFLRLMNANLIICLMGYDYLPDVPQTEIHKWQYETLREAMKYAQELGIKFHLAYLYNAVPQALWWKHPEFRCQGSPGYLGISFCWSRAKTLILKLHEERMKFFKDMDGYQLLYLEGCGICTCPECSKNFAGLVIDSFREIEKLLKEINPKAECVLQNWLAEVLLFWIPELKGIQDNLLIGMPKGTLFFDASGNFWKKWARTQGKDPSTIREQLNLIDKAGYRALNYFFLMDMEGGLESNCSVFPYPLIKEIMREMRYSKENLHLEGVAGYRLAPPIRFLSDYAFFRLASNPNLTMEQLVDEEARFLTYKPENKNDVKTAIMQLERFWNTMDAEALKKATELFGKASKIEPSKTLKYIADGTSILLLIHKLTDGNLSQEEQNANKMEIYQKMKDMFIYQGYTTEQIWEARALNASLLPRIEWWTKYMKTLQNILKK